MILVLDVECYEVNNRVNYGGIFLGDVNPSVNFRERIFVNIGGYFLENGSNMGVTVSTIT